ncbi:MAG TPA: hypothetical protein VM597_35335 [Gemmataceae bacterium]|nr:hypothetical protein [Gemmataceae bacterium]
MTHPSRVLLLLCLVAAGCSPKKPTGPKGDPTVGPARDGETAAVTMLEGHSDPETVKTALQRLDGLESTVERPTWGDSERDELAKLCRLTDNEVTALGQRTFTPSDALYLEQCLTIRSGLRALKLDDRPPADRGRLAFEWVCRTAYVDGRIPTPAPASLTLQMGYGTALSRAYAVLAAWQQAGLEGCLIGPASLKDIRAITQQGSALQSAPVRACGLRVGADIFLYDPAAGKPVPAADGKGVLTLAAARAMPALAKDLAGENEVKSWQAFVAPPANALARRMEWLEKLNPGSTAAKLFVDVRASAAGFKEAGAAATVWNAPDDPLSPVRIIGFYSLERPGPEGGPPKAPRDQLREELVPYVLLPQNKIVPHALGLVHEVFKFWYNRVWFSPGSPRDLYVRGDLADALSALNQIGSEISTVKSRVDQDRGLSKDFAEYFKKLFEMSADQQRARNDPEAFATATKQMMAFRTQAKNADIERSYTLGTAARPMTAEVLYLTAACVHERAERAQADGATETAAGWRNAAECWDRYLSEAAALRPAFPGREPHARAMRARCQSFLTK